MPELENAGAVNAGVQEAAADDTSVTVTTMDGMDVEIPKQQVPLFGMIRTMLEALHCDEAESAAKIPLVKVAKQELDVILRWTAYHADDPESSDEEDGQEEEEEDREDRRTDDIPGWDVDFIKQLVREDGTPGGDLSRLYALMQAVNFLDVRLLLTFCCKFVAHRLKDLTVEQAREQFHIVNDYTPEEEEQLKLDNAWAEAP